MLTFIFKGLFTLKKYYFIIRQILVEKVGRLKPKGDKSAVRANDRVAQVIANRRKEALELGLSPDVAESVWRSMIQAFIALEEKVNKEH